MTMMALVMVMVVGFGDGDVVATLVLWRATDRTYQCTLSSNMLQHRDGSSRHDEPLSSFTVISYRSVRVPDLKHEPESGCGW